MKSRTMPLVGLALLGMVGAVAFAQQQTGLRRTELQRHDISAPGREVVQARVEFDPGHGIPRHTHPGEEVVYVLEGTVEYQLDGKPPMTLKAGQAGFVPAGVVHSARNTGSGVTAEVATYIVEKGKPLITMVK